MPTGQETRKRAPSVSVCACAAAAAALAEESRKRRTDSDSGREGRKFLCWSAAPRVRRPDVPSLEGFSLKGSFPGKRKSAPSPRVSMWKCHFRENNQNNGTEQHPKDYLVKTANRKKFNQLLKVLAATTASNRISTPTTSVRHGLPLEAVNATTRTTPRAGSPVSISSQKPADATATK